MRSLDDDRGEQVRVIPLAGKADYADHMVVASGRSARKVAAMAEHLLENLKRAGFGPAHAEGLGNCQWVLIDAGDVIVHLFQPEVRDYYDLEKLWEAEFTAEARARAAWSA